MIGEDVEIPVGDFAEFDLKNESEPNEIFLSESKLEEIIDSYQGYYIDKNSDNQNTQSSVQSPQSGDNEKTNGTDEINPKDFVDPQNVAEDPTSKGYTTPNSKTQSPNVPTTKVVDETNAKDFVDPQNVAEDWFEKGYNEPNLPSLEEIQNQEPTTENPFE